MLMLGRKDVMVIVVLVVAIRLLMNGKEPDDGEASRLALVGAAAAENTEIGAEVERLSSSERREGKKGRKSGRERKWL